MKEFVPLLHLLLYVVSFCAAFYAIALLFWRIERYYERSYLLTAKQRLYRFIRACCWRYIPAIVIGYALVTTAHEVSAEVGFHMLVTCLAGFAVALAYMRGLQWIVRWFPGITLYGPRWFWANIMTSDDDQSYLRTFKPKQNRR